MRLSSELPRAPFTVRDTRSSCDFDEQSHPLSSLNGGAVDRLQSHSKAALALEMATRTGNGSQSL